ncbi:MAG: hypothetical protein ACOYJ1_03700 [Peptococcales bacterium]|jgi:hypothetical protein
MKTLILSDYDIISEYIKDALSELNVHTSDKFSWHTGKFYTKELLLVEEYNRKELPALLDLLLIDKPIKNIISIGLGNSLGTHLKEGDILINDYPSGSCQELVDRFLNDSTDEFGERPLRIFVGNIFDDTQEHEFTDDLACRDFTNGELFSTLKAKGLSTLAIRIILGEQDQVSLDTETINNVLPRLLLLLKQTVEQVS